MKTSLRQETFVPASPRRVFDLLTSGESFGAATGMPAEVGDREGDAFALFAGRIVGRQVELVPGERIVQAWRFGAEHPTPWAPGVYSTVRFGLEPEGDGTRLVIEHTGIPAEWVDHLTEGYPAFYLEPIRKFFAEPRSSSAVG